MAISVKHKFVSGVTDGADANQVQPSNWNAEHSVSGVQVIVAEGAFVDGDKTKLDGIETAADVTDTTNVTAAGALMDSEVDADLKTFALPANTTISAFGATLVDDLSATAARATLGGVITSASASAAFVTSASLATTLATYITSASLSADIVSRGFILSTSVSAAIAEFVTSASISTRIAATYDLGPTVSTSVSYSLAIADVGQTVVMNNASTNYVVVPSSASIAIAVGEVVNVVQKGAGATIIQGETGVTINGSLAGSATIQTQYQGVSLLKDSADSWIASGNIGTFAT